MTDEASLAGKMMTDVPLADVADALRRAGLEAYYHANPFGDEEMPVGSAGDADCLVERVGPGEYRVADSGGERAEVEDMARTMSAVLATMAIRHWLEVYDDKHGMFACLHYGWPLE